MHLRSVSIDYHSTPTPKGYPPPPSPPDSGHAGVDGAVLLAGCCACGSCQGSFILSSTLEAFTLESLSFILGSGILFYC